MQRIAGTFADFKLIKGRKVAQIVVEIPIEQADAIVAALGGLPNPAVERWVAMAPVNMEAARAASSETAEQRSNHSAQGEADRLRVSEGTRPASASPASERKPAALSSIVAMTGDSPSMQAYLRRRLGDLGWRTATEELERMHKPTTANDVAAQIIRRLCRVGSRSEIREGTVHSRLWHDLVADWHHWQRHEERAA